MQQLCPVIIGREAEVDALKHALGRVRAGRGETVLLLGEAGIGKSRLVRELTTWANESPMPIVTGRAVPASGSAAYRPLSEALSQLLRREPIPDDGALAPWLSLLQPVLALPSFAGAPAHSGEVSANVRGEALLQVLSRVCPNGVVVVLEDLHWADPDTVSVIEYLMDNLSGHSIMLALTLRNSEPSAALELASRSRGKLGLTRLDLERLEEDEIRTMALACQPDASPDTITHVSRAAEGIPLLVEELLTSPGLPVDFTTTVRARLMALALDQREVIEAAAVLGRNFDWELLSSMTGQELSQVTDALVAGVEAWLLSSQDAQVRFRHALTREAVLDTLLAPRQRELALAGLRALESKYPALQADQREVAIDLALRAGERRRAGLLLAESGRDSLAWGALSTAADALRRGADLLEHSSQRTAVELDLIEALSLAGRVDEAAVVGAQLINWLKNDAHIPESGAQVHLRLAHAAVAASRWRMARHHLDEARREPFVGGEMNARLSVLEAELSLADGDHDGAQAQAEAVLNTEDAPIDARCHAYEIVGRAIRPVNLHAARSAFESGLVSAEAADLPLWRLRALHQLGTVDLFDHAGVDRLLEARQAAERMGAMSTVAILDLQLAAGYTGRWELDACDEHARSALEVADRLGLVQVRAKAFAFLTGTAAMRADVPETEHYAARTLAADPEDLMLQGFCWATRAMAHLLAGEDELALNRYERGMAILATLEHAEPAAVRALWPVVLASRGDRRARPAIEEARRLGVGAFRLNQAMLGYAEAILLGRTGDLRRAAELVALADAGWTNCAPWADLCRVLAAPAAASDDWADVSAWLSGAAARFEARGLPAFAGRCLAFTARSRRNPWSRIGVSAREADVLKLVAEGLPNKEVAARLHLSVRTVEKHVESLLRKTGARSRTELASRLAATVPGRLDRPDRTT